MSGEVDTLLCVGGPLDGERISIERGRSWVRLPVPPLFRFSCGATETFGNLYLRYERHQFNAGTAKRWILTPQEQTDEETLDLLLNGYARDR